MEELPPELLELAYRAPEVGETFAGYLLEEQIGEGGFGQVFRAVKVSGGREVALKILSSHLIASPVGVGRLRREAKLAQRLEHPNTVRLFDFGQSDQGVPYIAFELLRGLRLDQVVVREAPMAVGRVAHVASQVLKSLMEAHELGIVHRDVKPENIHLIDFQGERDFVKVFDFGVAKAVLDAQGSQTALTAQGEVLGTPNYMAPEQVRGEVVGPSVDLYALGLVMAEMLTGQIVVQGTDPVTICAEQAKPTPVPLAPEIPSSPLGTVIVRATDKVAERRYSSAEAMLAAIRSVVAVTPASALEAPILGGAGGGGRASLATEPSAPPSGCLSETVIEGAPSGESRPAPAPLDPAAPAHDTEPLFPSPDSPRLAPPRLAPPRPPRPGPIAVLATFAAVTLIVVVTTVVALWFARVAPTPPPPGSSEALEPGGAPSTAAEDPLLLARLEALTAALIIERATASGWAASLSDVRPLPDGGRLLRVTLSRGSTRGTVLLFELGRPPPSPSPPAASESTPRLSTLRAGRRRLTIRLEPPPGQSPPQGAEELAEVLIGR